jgi:hypothetical protein
MGGLFSERMVKGEEREEKICSEYSVHEVVGGVNELWRSMKFCSISRTLDLLWPFGSPKNIVV